MSLNSMAHAKLGSGGRFKALQQKVEGEGKSPEAAAAIAAAAGMKRYGKSKMIAMAKAGKKK